MLRVGRLVEMVKIREKVIPHVSGSKKGEYVYVLFFLNKYIFTFP